MQKAFSKPTFLRYNLYTIKYTPILRVQSVDFWHMNTFLYLPPQSRYSISYSLKQRMKWHPTAVLLPGKSHGRRSLVGWSPWGREELDTTEWLHFHFSLSCIGEGNGNPLQCSCLENPRDRGAWWAAVWVAQSRTRLKRLSSSSLPWKVPPHPSTLLSPLYLPSLLQEATDVLPVTL